MARYTLPDGRVLDIDLEQLSSEDKVNLQNWLAETYPDNFDRYIEKDIQGYTAELFKGIPRGGLQTLASSAEGIVNLFDAGNDSEIGNSLRAFQQSLNENKYIGIGEGYEDAFATKLGAGLGSFASFLIPGGLAGKIAGRAGKGLDIAARKSLVQRAQTRGAAAVAVPAGVAEQGRNIERARELGEEVGYGQELVSELLGGAIGYTEVYSIERLLRYLPSGYAPVVNNRLGSAFVLGGMEGLQEATAGLLQDAVARGIYSEELPIGESALDDFTVGGAVGFIADLVLRNRMSGFNSDYVREQEQEARKRREELKFEAKEMFESTPESQTPDVDPRIILPELESNLDTLDANKVFKVKNQAAKVVGDLAVYNNKISNSVTPVKDNFGIDYAEIYLNEVFEKIEDNIRARTDLTEEQRNKLIQGAISSKSKELDDLLQAALDAAPTTAPDEPIQRLNAFNKEPVKEKLEIIDNPNGTFSVVGEESANDYGSVTYPDYNTAAIEMRKIENNIDKDFNTQRIKQALYLQGNYGNGTAAKIGSLVYDNLFNDIPKTFIANLDSTIKPARKTKTDAVKGAQQRINQGIFDDITGERPISEQDIAALNQIIEEGAQGNIPIKARKIQSDSLADNFNKKVEKLGLPIKENYTVAEAKKILNKNDFNDLMAERARVVHKLSVSTGTIFANQRNQDFIDSTIPGIQEILEKKNIETQISDAGFEYFAEQVTGEKKYSKMNQGQKDLLASRLKELPRFDVITKFPDFRPRPYTVKDVNDFYVNNKGKTITNEILKNNIKNRNGKNLSQNDIKILRQDLIDSGRAVVDKNKLKLTFDFELEQARRANGLNESQQEFRERLRNTTALSEEEIASRVQANEGADAATIEEGDLKLLPPPATLEKFERLFEIARGQLNKLGLSDVGLKFSDRLRSAGNLQEVNGKLVFTGATEQGAYDPSLNKIFLSFNSIDPNGTLTEKELESKIAGIMNHEVIHALRELDLLTEREYNLLVTYAKNTLKRIKVLNPEGKEVTLAQDITAKYTGPNTPDLDPVSLDEEYVAELFRVYVANPNDVKGKSKGILKKIVDFFKSILDAITGAGFRTPLGVLEDIKTGKIGKRERGKFRSNKDILAEQVNQNVPVTELKFSIDEDKLRKELDEAASELYTAQSILRAEGNRVSRRNYDAMYKRYQDANNKVIYLESELAKIPKQLSLKFGNVRKTGLPPKYSIDKITPRDPVVVEKKLTKKEKRNILDGEFVYHITPTKNARKIAEEGFNIFADSNYVKAGDGSRYQDSPGVFVFKNPYDAVAFVKRVNWKDEDNFSMIKLRKGNRRYEADKAADFQLYPNFSSNTAEDLGVELNEFSLNQLTRGQEDKSGNLRTTYYVPSLQTPEPFKPEDIVGIVTFPDMEKAFKDPIVDFRQYNNHSEESFNSNLDNPSPFGFAKIIDNLFETREAVEGAVKELNKFSPISPKFSRGTITPIELFGDGKLEQRIQREFLDNNKELTGKQIEDILKDFALKPTPKRKWIGTKELEQSMRDALARGDDPFWYERWADIKDDIGSANINEFSGVFGVTSEQAQPEKNLKDTLRTMIIARRVDPDKNPKKFINELKKANVGNKEPRRLQRILDFYELGILKREETGQKTATYGLEINRAMRNMFTPFSVIDRHMLRKFGIDSEKANQTEYRVMQAIIGNIAKYKGNNFTTKDGTPLNLSLPRQVQALIWADQRYTGPTRISNEGSYEAARRESSQELSEIKLMKQDGSFNSNRPLNGKFIYEPEYSTNIKDDPMSTEVSKDLYNVTMNQSPSLAIELKPGVGRGYLPENPIVNGNPLSFFDYRNFQLDVLKSITDGNQIKFLQDLGISHRVTESAGSYKDGFAVPNLVIQFPNSTATEIKDYGRLLGDAFLQDAVVYFKASTRGRQSTGVMFVKPDNSLLTQTELNDLVRDLKNIDRDFDFTLLAGHKVGPMVLDPKSFLEGQPYDKRQYANFLRKLVPLAKEKGYTLESFNGDSSYLAYETGQEGTSGSGYSNALERVRSKRGGLESSSLQRAALSNLYIPIYKKYEKFARQLDDFNLPPPPYTLPGSAVGNLNNINLKSAEARARAIKDREDLSPTTVPKFNENANPLALAIAYDYQDGKIPDDTPPKIPLKYSRTTTNVPEKYAEISKKVGESEIKENKTFGAAILDSFALTDDDSSVNFLDRIYKALVDRLAFVERGVKQSVDILNKRAEEGDIEAAEAQNWAQSGAMQQLRHTDKSNQIVAQAMTKGPPVIKRGDKDLGITTTIDFKHGGLADIFAPLYEDPSLFQNEQYMGEQLFKILAVGSRSETLNAQGIEVPLDEDMIKLAQEIRTDFPVVAQVYDRYQEFNAKVIEFAVETGILEGTRDPVDLARDIVKAAAENDIPGYKFNSLRELSLGELSSIAGDLNSQLRGTKGFEPIRIKSQADMWLENSNYYPFYRKMIDETIGGPNVAAGILSGNPLNIRIKGSKEALEPAPLDVIFRNLQAITNAAMKNEGLQRLMELHRQAGRAELATANTPITQKVTVYENGKKVEYQVADALLIDGLQSMNMADDSGFLIGLAAGASNILREAVTRDPIFMVRNLTRDSLVSRVITGVDYLPIIETFKKFNSDMTELERRGIIGGYDAARDPNDAGKFFRKLMKKRKLDEYGSLNPLDSVVQMWDWLGDLTTASDGATRNVVYEKVLELTDSQAEASYQALEIMNFNRRGSNPLFKIVTAAIPFLNARIQGLDVLARAHRGHYSAVKKLQGQSIDRKELESEIFIGTLTRGMFLAMVTALYYLFVSDDEVYKNARRETRDDNWLIPLGRDLPALKVPIPFEVGVLYKVIPERLIDLTFGDATFDQTMKSLSRQAIVTFKADPLGFQFVKPIVEVMNNRSAYLGTDIIPFYMKEGVTAQAQYNANTTEFSKGLSEALGNVGIDIAPIHLDYLITGYTGTIGVYMSAVADAVAKQTTGDEVVPRDIERLPMFRSILQSRDGGGLLQEFYEMRKESNKFIGTVNKLIKEGKSDQLNMYYNNPDGLLQTRAEILKLDRYIAHMRDLETKIRADKKITGEMKKMLIDEIKAEKQKRLAYFLPDLRDRITG